MKVNSRSRRSAQQVDDQARPDQVRPDAEDQDRSCAWAWRGTLLARQDLQNQRQPRRWAAALHERQRIAEQLVLSRNFCWDCNVGAAWAPGTRSTFPPASSTLNVISGQTAKLCACRPERLHEGAVEGAEAVGRSPGCRSPARCGSRAGTAPGRRGSAAAPSCRRLRRLQSASRARGGCPCAARRASSAAPRAGRARRASRSRRSGPRRRPCRAGRRRRSRSRHGPARGCACAAAGSGRPVRRRSGRSRRGCRRRPRSPRPRPPSRPRRVQPLHRRRQGGAVVKRRHDHRRLDAHRSSTCQGSQWRAG